MQIVFIKNLKKKRKKKDSCHIRSYFVSFLTNGNKYTILEQPNIEGRKKKINPVTADRVENLIHLVQIFSV